MGLGYYGLSVEHRNSRGISGSQTYLFEFSFIHGRFYARDVKVVKTHLTSKTLKPSGIKTGRIKVDKLTDKNKIFLKK